MNIKHSIKTSWRKCPVASRCMMRARASTLLSNVDVFRTGSAARNTREFLRSVAKQSCKNPSFRNCSGMCLVKWNFGTYSSTAPPYAASNAMSCRSIAASSSSATRKPRLPHIYTPTNAPSADMLATSSGITAPNACSPKNRKNGMTSSVSEALRYNVFFFKKSLSLLTERMSVFKLFL